MSAHIKEAVLVIGGFGSLYTLYRFYMCYANNFNDVISLACRRERNAYSQDNSLENLVHLRACIENEKAEGGFYSPNVPSPAKRLR